MKAKITFFLNNIITEQLISVTKTMVLTCDITNLIMTYFIIFNLSIQSRKIPNELKEAITVPVHKKGSKCDPIIYVSSL